MFPMVAVVPIGGGLPINSNIPNVLIDLVVTLVVIRLLWIDRTDFDCIKRYIK
jgi:hypothetical protein